METTEHTSAPMTEPTLETSTPSPVSQENGISPAPKKKKLGKIIAIVIGAIVLLLAIPTAIFIYILFSATAEPANAAEEFLTLTAAGDYEAAYGMTSADFQSVATVEGLELFTESYPVLDNMTSVELTYRGMSNEVMVVSGVMSAGADTSPITFQLVEEDGEWKVRFFSLNPDDVPSEEDVSITTEETTDETSQETNVTE